MAKKIPGMTHVGGGAYVKIRPAGEAAEGYYHDEDGNLLLPQTKGVSDPVQVGEQKDFTVLTSVGGKIVAAGQVSIERNAITRDKQVTVTSPAQLIGDIDVADVEQLQQMLDENNMSDRVQLSSDTSNLPKPRTTPVKTYTEDEVNEMIEARLDKALAARLGDVSNWEEAAQEVAEEVEEEAAEIASDMADILTVERTPVVEEPEPEPEVYEEHEELAEPVGETDDQPEAAEPALYDPEAGVEEPGFLTELEINGFKLNLHWHNIIVREGEGENPSTIVLVYDKRYNPDFKVDVPTNTGGEPYILTIMQENGLIQSDVFYGGQRFTFEEREILILIAADLKVIPNEVN